MTQHDHDAYLEEANVLLVSEISRLTGLSIEDAFTEADPLLTELHDIIEVGVLRRLSCHVSSIADDVEDAGLCDAHREEKQQERLDSAGGSC